MGGSFAAMCSTQADSFGSVENKSEVPRIPLIDALGKKSALVRSDQIKVTVGDGVAPVKGSPKNPPAPTRGKYDVGDIYVDYLF